jgi:formate dehydrogenase subunit gamma
LALLFVAGLAVMLIAWFKESLFTRVDWEWVKQGGGYLKKGTHAHAGRVNAGEKVWFWLLFFAGIGVCVSGFYLLFPNLGWDRGTMQVAMVIHSILGILLIAFSLGHIYLGSIGNEGSLEGMVTGKVDAEWAKQHHDLWYEEVVSQGGESPTQSSSKPQPSTPPSTA